MVPRQLALPGDDLSRGSGAALWCHQVRASAGARLLGEDLVCLSPLAFAPLSALCPRVPALERVSAVAGMPGRDAVVKARG